MGKLLKMGEAAQYINVSQDCLRKWDRANKLKPLKTAGGHRRYSTDVLDEFLGVIETLGIKVKCLNSDEKCLYQGAVNIMKNVPKLAVESSK